MIECSSKESIYFFILTAESPIFPNPSISEIESDAELSYLLKWSPSFLWPGHDIKYFNITINETSDRSVIHDSINTTFSDIVVSYTRRIDKMCSEFSFGISAISSFDRELQPIYYVNGRYPSSEHYTNLCMKSNPM